MVSIQIPNKWANFFFCLLAMQLLFSLYLPISTYMLFLLGMISFLAGVTQTLFGFLEEKKDLVSIINGLILIATFFILVYKVYSVVFNADFPKFVVEIMVGIVSIMMLLVFFSTQGVQKSLRNIDKIKTKPKSVENPIEVKNEEVVSVA